MQRIHILICIASTSLLLTQTREATAAGGVREGGNIGLGLGWNSLAVGLSGKYFFGDDTSIQGVIGEWRYFGFGDCRRYRNDRFCDDSSLALGADFLYEGPELVGNGSLSLAWHAGGGAAVGIQRFGRAGLAASFVAGLQINVDAIPIDFAIEVRPTIFVAPIFDIDWFYGSAHIRYYF